MTRYNLSLLHDFSWRRFGRWPSKPRRQQSVLPKVARSIEPYVIIICIATIQSCLIDLSSPRDHHVDWISSGVMSALSGIATERLLVPNVTFFVDITVGKGSDRFLAALLGDSSCCLWRGMRLEFEKATRGMSSSSILLEMLSRMLQSGGIVNVIL